MKTLILVAMVAVMAAGCLDSGGDEGGAGMAGSSGSGATGGDSWACRPGKIPCTIDTACDSVCYVTPPNSSVDRMCFPEEIRAVVICAMTSDEAVPVASEGSPLGGWTCIPTMFDQCP